MSRPWGATAGFGLQEGDQSAGSTGWVRGQDQLPNRLPGVQGAGAHATPHPPCTPHRKRERGWGKQAGRQGQGGHQRQTNTKQQQKIKHAVSKSSSHATAQDRRRVSLRRDTLALPSPPRSRGTHPGAAEGARGESRGGAADGPRPGRDGDTDRMGSVGEDSPGQRPHSPNTGSTGPSCGSPPASGPRQTQEQTDQDGPGREGEPSPATGGPQPSPTNTTRVWGQGQAEGNKTAGLAAVPRTVLGTAPWWVRQA